VFAPAKVSADAPPLVNENDPPKAPLKTTGLETVNVALDPNVPTPENVSAPV
jgi:hypothetical protein